MKRHARTLSIRRTVIVIFLISMLITIGGTGYLVYANWFSSAEQTTKSVAKDISETICNQISSFVRLPEEINEANHKILESGILDLTDDALRDKFFVGVLASYENEIYSFSYGTINGEYYGARRNESGVIEIMRNDVETGGNSWYYSVNDDMTAGSLVVQAGQFDPRTRPWYIAAETTGDPTLSPVYKHFVMDDLAISAACPVYDADRNMQGVMGTHMLLTGVGSYLEKAVQEYQGYSVILELNSGALIANSMGDENFSVLQDGTFNRYGIAEIQNPDMRKACERYFASHDTYFYSKGENTDLYVHTQEIHRSGMDWVVITAIPEGFLMAEVVDSIRWSAILGALALILSVVVYNMVMRTLLKPMNGLLQAAAALSSGELSERAVGYRNDEIGSISESLNKVADKMQDLINNLETNVRERTEELNQANAGLEENKNQLRLILDSAAEAIYGIDLNGNCTFCNLSCIQVLGYNSQEDLLGKNMHWQIHHSRPGGAPFPIEECRIIQSMILGKGFSTDDEVFWKADRTPIAVEYHSYPQIKNGEVIGAVITFMDITDRKQRAAEIEYLNCHDIMTGLQNRRCFEENRARIDIPENLPLSVIFADINGLKMTNDIFGHASGDELIKKSAGILMQCCREHDVVARVGGDEFILLLPKTNEKNAKKILSRIKSEFSYARVEAIQCSISLGSDTKTSTDQSLEEIIADAENAMYKDKTMNRNTINRDMIDTIVETLHARSPIERLHSVAVGELCGEMGTAMGLPEPEINQMKRAGYLHDIGKIILDESILAKDTLKEEELEKMRQHASVGYRILSLFDDTLDLAEYVYCHHERWDGKGYPRGLKEEQIPQISRIISVVETYDRVLNRGTLPPEERRRNALKSISENEGTQFDPRIADLFLQMIKEKDKSVKNF